MIDDSIQQIEDQLKFSYNFRDDLKITLDLDKRRKFLEDQLKIEGVNSEEVKNSYYSESFDEDAEPQQPDYDDDYNKMIEDSIERDN